MDEPWTDILRPDLVRSRFLRAGLFLVAHEMLLSSIKDRLSDFFSNSWSAETGWTVSPAYREKVLPLDPKKKGDPLRASLVWLRNMNVIDNDDEAMIRHLTEERNRLAHEMHKVISGSIEHDFENLFPAIAKLISKIDRWWIINVEIATDELMLDEEIDESAITSGSTILLQILTQVALGNDEDAWELYNAFVRQKHDVS